MFSRLWQFIRQVIHRMFPFKDVAAVEHIDTPLSNEMIDALDLWYKMYTDSPPWLSPGKVKSLNLPSLICSEVARQVLLEVKWNISGKADENGNAQDSSRAEYLKAEFGKLMQSLRPKLEQACAAGGMTIKPYPKDGHIYFDCATAWSLYPIAFDDDGALKDVIFRDSYQDGKTTYTRLERHTVTDKGISITQRAFRSNNRESIGVEIPLTDVPQWAEAEPEALLTDTEGQMFGWFKTANANNVDIDAPMGVAVFNKAVNIIREADMQYSRILWEYEGSELAIDVDPTVLRPQINGRGRQEMPQLNERLFRGVDLGDDHYQVFSPAIRDSALFNGLNQLSCASRIAAVLPVVRCPTRIRKRGRLRSYASSSSAHTPPLPTTSERLSTVCGMWCGQWTSTPPCMTSPRLAITTCPLNGMTASSPTHPSSSANGWSLCRRGL